MKRSKRKALLTTLLGLTTLVTAIPMVLSGTANAQTNSRLCGQFWRSPRSNEVVTRIFEVRRSDTPVCNQAKRGSGPEYAPMDWNYTDKQMGDWLRDSFSFHICETTPGSEYEETKYGWKDRPPEIGGLGGRDLDFIDDHVWPRGDKDQYDICINMNRSDTIFEMEEYWLHYKPEWSHVAFLRD